MALMEALKNIKKKKELKEKMQQVMSNESTRQAVAGGVAKAMSNVANEAINKTKSNMNKPKEKDLKNIASKITTGGITGALNSKKK